MIPRTATAKKIFTDCLMIPLFTVAAGFRLTGAAAHEWTGTVLLTLFAVHCALNRRWFQTFAKGRHDYTRVLRSAVTVSLIACMAILFLTGFMNSHHVLGFLELDGGMAARQVHSLAAYWSLVLAGVHLGLHWQKAAPMARNAARLPQYPRLAEPMRFVRTGAALILTTYGVWASFDRGMGAKLFLGFAFDYWDTERPAFLFYTHTAAVMGLYAVCAHYALKLPTPFAGTAPRG